VVVLVGISAFLTAILSGLLGMAGGLVLMGIYASALPVASAMVLHGSTQLVANGTRAWTLREHVDRRILGWYAVGAIAAFAVGSVIRLVPAPALVFLALGAIPFVAQVIPRGRFTAIENPAAAVLCGALVVGVQLIAGVAGPILDVFFVDAPLDRQQVVATKAVTQVLSHALKLAVFLPYALDVSPTLIAVACVCALAGTRVGVSLLERASDEQFRRASRLVVLAIGAFYLCKGIAAAVAAG
jgi:uncharacterized membrane protein YfcA